MAHWLAVVVLTPLLMLGALGGTTFLAHRHDGHGLHLHAADTATEVERSAADHRAAHRMGDCPFDPAAGAAADHRHGHAGSSCSESGPPSQVDRPDETHHAPDGLLVSVPDHEQLLRRGIDLSEAFPPGAVLISAAPVAPPPPDLARQIGSPGGLRGCGPLDLRALSAGDRLVRTSCALLL